MARTFMVADTVMGIEARITTRQTDEGATIVSHLEMVDTDGTGLRSEYLRLFEEMGLALPPTVAPAVAAPPPAPKPKAAPQTAPRAVSGRLGRKPEIELPPPEQMMADYVRSGVQEMAAMYGVPAKRVQSKINRLRTQGYDFPFRHARQGSKTSAAAAAASPLFSEVTDGR